MNISKPLGNFPLIRSRNVEEVREAIGRIYSKPALMPMRGTRTLNAAVNNCPLQYIGLTYSTYGAAVGLEYPATGIFSQVVPIRGSGQIVRGQASAVLTVGDSAVISPETDHKVNFNADYEHLVLRINARKLTEKLAAMTGAQINAPLRIGPLQTSKHPAAQMLQHYLPLLVDALSGAAPPFPNWWIAQTEQLLMALFLCGHRHNYSHLLEQSAPDSTPREVRQAEEYIEANAQRAVTLEQLAEITGVSAFSLFGTFKKHRGYSPLKFLAQVRSRHRGPLQ